MPHINDEHRLCLWHIPKTGGTWACRALAACGIVMATHGQHMAPCDTANPCPGARHAVIVREPVAWYGAMWRWLKRAGPGAEQFWSRWGGGQDDDFARFLVINCGMWRSFGAVFTPTRGLVLRTEHLADDLAAWLTACGVPFNRAQLLRQPRAAVAEEPPPRLDPQLVQMIYATEGYRP